MASNRSNSTDHYKQVAIAILARGNAYPRDKIFGLINYYSKHSQWEIHRNQFSQPFVDLASLSKWNGDGAVGEIYTQDERDLVDALSMPFVNTSSSENALGLPSVSVDNELIGEMGAKHLMECDVDKFIFVGPTDIPFVQQRYNGFKRALEGAKHTCSTIPYAPNKGAHDRFVSEDVILPAELMKLLGDLPTPVGIMATSDRVGFAVLEACRRKGLRSPEDVAVVGVNNDEMYCMLAHSSLTSIDVQARELGFRAGQMLDDLMHGKELKEYSILIPPKGIVYRDSTDMTRSQYPEVARALRFIRNHDAEFIDVTNVLDVVPVSRRWLEMKFKEEVGHGIYQEIRRVHVERAKKLLVTTRHSISQLSRECGFNSAERFEFSFQKLVGMSTSEYRGKNTELK